MQWVQARIKSASLVVAVLTDRNAKVFVEIGYAWGCGVPTTLLTPETENLTFDLQGQRCLVYKSIRQLQETLSMELKSLSQMGIV